MGENKFAANYERLWDTMREDSLLKMMLHFLDEVHDLTHAASHAARGVEMALERFLKRIDKQLPERDVIGDGA